MRCSGFLQYLQNMEEETLLLELDQVVESKFTLLRYLCPPPPAGYLGGYLQPQEEIFAH